MDELIERVDKIYTDICAKENIIYIKISDEFKQNDNFLPNPFNIHPNYEGYEAISAKIITYLENEKQSIIDYLSNKSDIGYKNINEFIKKIRLFLVPILTKVSGNVSKIDVMEQIKDYALSEMNNKIENNSNGYINLILSEIDKIKSNKII